MSQLIRKNFSVYAIQRQLKAIARTVISSGTRVLKRSINAFRPQSLSNRENWNVALAFTAGGSRRYFVYRPHGMGRSERLPLVVMLHGCGQDAKGFAASTQMNRVADRERFLVLYVEQDPLANVKNCWNWFDTGTGRAQKEAAIIVAAIDQVCISHPVNDSRIAIAGLSAGASMAALVASLYPARFAAVAMHSGIATGFAHSSATAFGAMRGFGPLLMPGPTTPSAIPLLPALLVIQGSNDPVVAPVNGEQAATRWATETNGLAAVVRNEQLDSTYPLTITDWHAGERIVATLCEVNGLGHAWSGGDAAHEYTDSKGPNAAQMIWNFAVSQFETAAARVVPAIVQDSHDLILNLEFHGTPD